MKIFSQFTHRLVVFGALCALAACSSTAKEQTNAEFSLGKITSPWSKSNAKYADLANGPLSSEIGRSLSDAAKKVALEAEYRALESAKTGEPVLWQYSATENGKVTPFPPYQVGSSKCRRYVHAVSVSGQLQQAAATACRNKAGVWAPLT